eukprot:SAG31_NODE_14395_length_809_cov_1.398592_2_plen_66_part_00
MTNSRTTLERQMTQTNEKIVRVSRDGEQALQEAQAKLNSKQQERVMLERTKASNQVRANHTVHTM